MQTHETQKPIVFFDGACGLCNGFADFVLAQDKQALFRIATLQGETAGVTLGKFSHTTLAPSPGKAAPENNGLSMVLWEGGQVYRKSEAVLRILKGLGGWWKVASALRLAPRFLRDAVYDIAAQNRYRWFGKRDKCRMPKPEEAERFLP